jgi:hypothetical protein
MTKTTPRRKRAKASLCIVSAVAVGVALADYFTPVEVPVAASFCCDNSWECTIPYRSCQIDFACGLHGFFGHCVS